MRRFGLVLAILVSSSAFADEPACHISLVKPATINVTDRHEKTTTYRIPSALLNLPDVAPLLNFVKTLGPTEVLVTRYVGNSKLFLIVTRDGSWVGQLEGRKRWFGAPEPLNVISPYRASNQTLEDYVRQGGSFLQAAYEYPEMALGSLLLLPIKSLTALVASQSRRMAIVTLKPESFMRLVGQLNDPEPFRVKMKLPEDFRLDGASNVRIVLAEASNWGNRLDQAVTAAVAAIVLGLRYL